MAAFAITVEFETTLFLAAFALSILSAVFLGWFLLAMFRRAAVKRYLQQRGCKPIKVRWLVFAWFCPWIPVGPSVWVLGTAFRVIYSDPNRLIHKAYCWVGYDVGVVVAPIFSGFARRIEWVKDEIIGELPLPIVLLWMAFLLPSHLCSGGEAPPNSKPLTLDTYLQQLGYGSIPLKRTEQNHLAVDGELAGKKAVFLIDTGNSITRLDKKIGSRFKTLAERGIRLEDPNLGELSGTNFVLVEEMKLGTARFPNQPANVTPLAHVATSRYEIDINAYEDCLIGCDFLLRHHCLLDSGRLKLYVRADKPSTEVRAALESTLRQSGYHETVLKPTPALVELCPAKVNGVAIRLVVDSGSVFTLLDDHQGKQSPLAKLRVSNTDTLNQGVGKRGGTPIYVAEPESFELDGIEISLRKVRLGAADLISFNIGRFGSQLQNADGILGADVLAVCGSLVDLENRRLWFVIPKNAASSKPQ